VTYATKQAAATYQRERVKRNRENPPAQIPHGINGYTNFACRCQQCRDANAAEQRKLVARWRAEGPKSHGIAGYKAGCRCETCRTAKSVQAAKFRARRKQRKQGGESS